MSSKLKYVSYLSYCAPQMYIPHQDLQQNAKYHLRPLNLSATDSVNSLKPYPSMSSFQTSNASVRTDEDESNRIAQTELRDQKWGPRIKSFKLVSLLVGVVLSLATFIPLAVTLNEYLKTKNVYVGVDGQPDNWTENTITWPLYTFFAISLISMVSGLVMLMAHGWQMKKASKASRSITLYDIGYGASHTVMWLVGIVLYRVGDASADGKDRDLWRWTCSNSGKTLQGKFGGEIHYNTYCSLQSSSFYLGIVTLVISLLVLLPTGACYWYLRSQSGLKSTASSRHLVSRAMPRLDAEDVERKNDDLRNAGTYAAYAIACPFY